tara:strand:+ start:847 stop:1821 length:975 start_codon:yes stop_codon:yes gene_type:complete
MKSIGLLLPAVSAFLSIFLSADEIILSQAKGRIDVKISGKLFTSYHYDGVPKPTLYPVRWIDGTGMTRRFPMEKALPGESNDHMHHRSVFWGHRHVKGGKDGGVHDFWGENSNSGKQVAIEVKCIKNGSIYSNNKWVSKAGETIATDSRIISFSSEESGRNIDYVITIKASEGDIVLMDDKDAGMGFRVPDTMCVSPHGTAKVKAEGYMLNSEGITGANCWGKRAKWIDYSGLVEGKILGIAMFDHPDNPRHPTGWHARSYGLCSANIFGKRHFEKLPDKNAGNYSLKKGQSITFKYRLYWHAGKGDSKKIESQYRQWVAAKDK